MWGDDLYANYLKRILDFILSLVVLILLSPFLFVLVLIGAVIMKGNPFFTQIRPGKIDPNTGYEKLFKMIKLRTMTNEVDINGDLLPDEKRLTPYGKWLRSTSADELFELINILKGDMSIVGPRPQLVRDMVFMSVEQRKRHKVQPGLTGLAQSSGRNNMTWEKKFLYDLQYIENITFLGDLKIIWTTIFKVLKSEGITEENMETAMDFGDYLLKNSRIKQEEYDIKQKEAEELLRNK